jgi:hypothetical protein
MEPGNKKHRYSYSGGIKAVETEKWGRSKAASRYGELQHRDGALQPKGSPPKDPEGKPAAHGDISVNSWLRGGGGNGKPRR